MLGRCFCFYCNVLVPLKFAATAVLPLFRNKYVVRNKKACRWRNSTARSWFIDIMQASVGKQHNKYKKIPFGIIAADAM